jgi:hypothetical protein
MAKIVRRIIDYSGALVLLCRFAWCQAPTIKQEAKDSSCTNIVALTGNVNINCSSLTPAQRKIIDSIPALLNKIFVNQLDPEAVMTKLDEMHRDIRQIRDNQGWPELSVEQMRSITAAASPFPGQKMSIMVPNPEQDTQAFAMQISQALKAAPANWIGSVQTAMVFRTPDSPVPLGIEFRVRNDGPAIQALAKALGDIVGVSALHGYKDEKFAADEIGITVLWKPRQ